MGSSNENSAYGPVRNPWDPDARAGGILGRLGGRRRGARRTARDRHGHRAAPSGSRPRSAGSSGSSRPTGASRATGSSPSPRRSTRPGRSRGAWTTRPSPSPRWPAPTRATRRSVPPCPTRLLGRASSSGQLRVGLLAEAEAPEGGLHPDVGACLHEVAALARRGRSPDPDGVRPPGRVRGARLLPLGDRRGLLEPGALRRRPLRGEERGRGPGHALPEVPRPRDSAPR